MHLETAMGQCVPSSYSDKKNDVKQRDDHIKSDWFQLLAKDFQFIKEDMDEKEIGEMYKAL